MFPGKEIPDKNSVSLKTIFTEKSGLNCLKECPNYFWFSLILPDWGSVPPWPPASWFWQNRQKKLFIVLQ